MGLIWRNLYLVILHNNYNVLIISLAIILGKNSLLKIKCVKECLQKPVMIAKYQKILEKYYNNN